MTDPKIRTKNIIHYPSDDATDPRELASFLDAISTDLASTSNGEGAALIGIEDSGGLITATTVEGALAENRTAIDALESGKADKDQSGRFCIHIETPSNKDYIYLYPWPNGATLTAVWGYCVSGTIDAQVKINTTSVTGGNISISSSGASSSMTASNTALSTDVLRITLSNNSSASDLSIAIGYTEVLAVS